MPIININPVAFSLGAFDIRWYSLSYICGILISWLIIKKVLIKHKNNIDSNIINNCILTFIYIYIYLDINMNHIYNFLHLHNIIHYL